MGNTIQVDCWYCRNEYFKRTKCPFCGGSGHEIMSIEQAQKKLLQDGIKELRRKG